MGSVMSGPDGGLSLGIYLARHEYPWRPANDKARRTVDL